MADYLAGNLDLLKAVNPELADAIAALDGEHGKISDLTTEPWQIPEDTWVHIISGFGSGSQIRELFDGTDNRIAVIVWEPDLYLIRSALSDFDFRPELSVNELIILHCADQALIHKQISGPTCYSICMGVAYHRFDYTYEQQPEFYDEMMKLFLDYFAFAQLTLFTALNNSVMTQQNVSKNLIKYVSTSSIDIYKEKFKGIPAIIVSAGPSLSKNIELLLEVKGKGIIIAVQTVLKRLLKMGIVPDFITALDYSALQVKFYSDLPPVPSNVTLIAEPKVNPIVPEVWGGPILFCGNMFAEKILGELGGKHDGLKAGSTVAHLAYYWAEYMGCDPIIFIGQDLAFPNNEYYDRGVAEYVLDGTQTEKINKHQSILTAIPAIGGGEVLSDDQMATYLEQFERDFAQSKARIIDATEGGALKKHVTTMTLRAVIDRYMQCVPEFKIDLPSTLPLPDLKPVLKKRIIELGTFKTICNNVRNILEQLKNLLDNPPAFNAKVNRITLLKEQLSHVGAAWDLIVLTKDKMEFERFCRDKRIFTKIRNQGPEDKKKEIDRDILYMSDLMSGCDLMADLLRKTIKEVANDCSGGAKIEIKRETGKRILEKLP